MIARNTVSFTVLALGIALVSTILSVEPVEAVEAVASNTEAQYDVRVTGARVNVRAQPTTKSEVLFQVTRGDTLRLVEKAESWYLVESSDDNRGYIHATLVELIELAPIVTSQTALRPSPGIPALTTVNEEAVAEAQAKSWAEKKRKSGLYKLLGGGAGVVSGLAFMGSSKPLGVGLMGAGGYFIWDGYSDRQEAGRRFRWTLLLQMNRDVRGVAYHMSW